MILQEFRKEMTRPLDLLQCEIWDLWERIMLPKKFNTSVFWDPLFIATPGKGVGVYYNYSDQQQNADSLMAYLDHHLSLLSREKIAFDYHVRKVKEILQLQINNPRQLHQLLLEIWPMITIADRIGTNPEFIVSTEMQDFCLKVRAETDGVLHAGLTYLSQLHHSTLSSQAW